MRTRITYKKILQTLKEAGVYNLSEDDILNENFDAHCPYLLLVHQVNSLKTSKSREAILELARIDGELDTTSIFYFLPLDDPRYGSQNKEGILALIKEVQLLSPRSTIGLNYNATERFFPHHMEYVKGNHPDIKKAVDYLKEQINAYESQGIRFRTGIPYGYGRKKFPSNKDCIELKELLDQNCIKILEPDLRQHLKKIFDHFVLYTNSKGSLITSGLTSEMCPTDTETYRSLPQSTLIQFKFSLCKHQLSKPLILQNQLSKFPLYTEIRQMSEDKKRSEATERIFCPEFWIHATFDENLASSCCYAKKPYLWSKYHPQTTSIKAHFDSDKYQEARWKIIHGKAQDVCSMKCPIYYRYRKYGQYNEIEKSLNSRWTSVPLKDFPSQGLSPFQENFKKLAQKIRESKIDLNVYPLRLTVRLGTQCNLKCKMCSQIRRPLMIQDQRILEQILQGLPYLKFLKLTGGEPFIFPFMKKVCEEADKYPELKLHATTNGVLIESDFWFEKISRHFHHLDISVDAATKGTYDKIRIDGDFNKVMRVTKELTSRCTGSSFKLAWDFCAQNDNYREIVDFVYLAKEHGVNSINFQMMGVPKNYESDVGPEDDLLNSKDKCIATLKLMERADTLATELGIVLSDQIRPNIFFRYPELANKIVYNL